MQALVSYNRDIKFKHTIELRQRTKDRVDRLVYTLLLLAGLIATMCGGMAIGVL